MRDFVGLRHRTDAPPLLFYQKVLGLCDTLIGKPSAHIVSSVISFCCTLGLGFGRKPLAHARKVAGSSTLV